MKLARNVITITVLLIGLEVGWLSRDLGRQSKPVLFQGQSVDSWLELGWFDDVGEPRSDDEAFRQLGTNALPALIAGLSFREPIGNRLWYLSHGLLPWGFYRSLGATPVPAEFHRGQAAWRLGQLGPMAAAAVPALIRALGNEQDATARGWIMYSLGSIGGPATNAIPALQRLLQTRDDETADVACEALERIYAP